MNTPATPPCREAGFTLIEVLVALAVLAVGAVSLLGAAQTHAARISQIETRSIARWVADSQLAATRLGLSIPVSVQMMGRTWSVTRSIAGTSDPDLARVDIAVARGADGDVVYRLTGFFDAIAAATSPVAAQ